MSTVAIIGTREPDQEQADLAMELSMYLTSIGIYVATGGAYGIDNCAMKGSRPGKLVVYLPWASYNSGIIPFHAIKSVLNPFKHKDWIASVDKYHPNPQALRAGARLLHAINYPIIHGSDAVVAFPDSEGGGGTAQGIRIANRLGIPTFQYNKGSFVPSLDEIKIRLSNFGSQEELVKL